MKYQKAGVVNQELVEIIRMNVRIPERAMGDLRAQVIAVKTGERRFLELVRRYGREEVHGGDRKHHGQLRGRGARADPNHSRRHLRGRVVHGRRRLQRRPARADQGARRQARRRDDDRPFRDQPAGAGLLQFRPEHRPVVRAGRLQVPHLADRLPGERRQLPPAEGDRAEGQGGERDQARGDALVDDLPDDRGRHRDQGAVGGDSGAHHRRAPCRPGVRDDPRHLAARRALLHRGLRPGGRRLGRASSTATA